MYRVPVVEVTNRTIRLKRQWKLKFGKYWTLKEVHPVYRTTLYWVLKGSDLRLINRSRAGHGNERYMLATRDAESHIPDLYAAIILGLNFKQ